jgi:hypothetical protein
MPLDAVEVQPELVEGLPARRGEPVSDDASVRRQAVARRTVAVVFAVATSKEIPLETAVKAITATTDASDLLTCHLANPVRQFEIIASEPALGMGGEDEGHLVPANVDVWMMIHLLRLVADAIHEVQCSHKVGQLVRRSDCRHIGGRTGPVRQSRQLLGHLGICQEWTHSRKPWVRPRWVSRASSRIR